MVLHLDQLTPVQRQNYLQAAIGPRPICFASTVNRKGEVNLSPFSFFNMFSTTPPIIIFSPSRRVRNNTTKHTLHNVVQVPEVVVNIVDVDMVQQVSLSSCDYPEGVNEFVKAGFTAVPSVKVTPPRVKESKVNFECRVIEIKPLGEKGGSGNLLICEILVMHIDERILDEKQMIDQKKLHQVARLGGGWYCRVDETNLFEIEKPNVHLGIGFDALPAAIRNSSILSGNDLAQLANVSELPVIDPAFDDDRLKKITQYFSNNPDEMEKELHRYAKKLLEEKKIKEAWQVLLTL